MVFGHFTRSGQVFFGGRYRQRFAGVVEACRILRIDRKLAGGANVNACQIADRVVVVRTTEPPRQHDAWVAGLTARLVFADGTELSDGCAPLLRRRMPIGPPPHCPFSRLDCRTAMKWRQLTELPPLRGRFVS
jgi:hypothetical protein